MRRSERGAALLLMVIGLISIMLTFTATAYKLQFYQLKQVHQLVGAKEQYWLAVGQLECALALIHENSFETSFDLCRIRHDDQVGVITWSVSSKKGTLTSQWQSVILTQELRISHGKATLVSGGYYEP